MLKYFKDIRLKLLANEKVSKYIYYAVGEIIIVMIGIFLGLQVNAWNQKRIENEVQTNYLKRISEDVGSDTVLIYRYFFENSKFDMKIKALNLARDYYSNKYIVQDTFDFLKQIAQGALISGNVSVYSLGLLDELIGTGNIKLIDHSVREKIMNYYFHAKINNSSYEVQSNAYITFIQSNTPFDYYSFYKVNDFDKRRVLNKMKCEEFYMAANLEISLAFIKRKNAIELKRRAIDLLNAIANKIKI